MSISVDAETIAKIQSKLRSSIFRNKSHIVEEAIKEYLKNG